MEAFTRINVAKIIGKHPLTGEPQYEHFFRVDIKGHNTDGQKQVHKELKRAFHKPEYKISVTRWDCVGHSLDWE